jgi:alpha-maltose-1-phosphate synthase
MERMSSSLSVGIVTREYPPEVYGGAGVHVANLVRFLTRHLTVRVHCFGSARSGDEIAGHYHPWEELAGARPELSALRTFSTDLAIAARLNQVHVCHTHTWYANMAGHLAKLLYGIPHVMTSHSLEPLRPWKVDQLGGGYRLSSFIEQTAIYGADAVVAVSSGMKRDIIASYPQIDPNRVHVIYNGVDTDEIGPDPRTDALRTHGIDPNRPTAVFVGRVTKQKGIVHLLDAAEHMTPGAQLVLCAGEPDSPEIAAEVAERGERLLRRNARVVWIHQMLARHELAQILTHASVFVCPSVYEPFGIVNLEAMACGLPVVASSVGGIPEIVVPGETGTLVPFQTDGSAFGTPADPERFARDLASAMNEFLESKERATRFGQNGRARAVSVFSWATIAEQTAALYRRLLDSR